MIRHYSPTTWKVKKMLNDEEIEFIGYSYVLKGAIYFVVLSRENKIVLYDKKENGIYPLKDRLFELKEAENG